MATRVSFSLARLGSGTLTIHFEHSRRKQPEEELKLFVTGHYPNGYSSYRMLTSGLKAADSIEGNA